MMYSKSLCTALLELEKFMYGINHTDRPLHQASDMTTRPTWRGCNKSIARGLHDKYDYSAFSGTVMSIEGATARVTHVAPEELDAVLLTFHPSSSSITNALCGDCSFRFYTSTGQSQCLDCRPGAAAAADAIQPVAALEETAGSPKKTRKHPKKMTALERTEEAKTIVARLYALFEPTYKTPEEFDVAHVERKRLRERLKVLRNHSFIDDYTPKPPVGKAFKTPHNPDGRKMVKSFP